MSNATGAPSTSTGSSALSFGAMPKMPSAIARASPVLSARRGLWLRERRIDERPQDGRLVAQQFLFDLHRARVDHQVQRGRLGRRKAAQLIVRVEHHGVVRVEGFDPGAEITQGGRI